MTAPRHPAEKRLLATRVASRLLTAPPAAHRRIGGRDPVVIDGRVLNRRLQTLIALGSRQADPEPGAVPVDRQRRELARFARIGMPIRTDVAVVDRRIAGPASDLAVRVYRRYGTAAGGPVIVYFHGGGFMLGDLDTHDASCRLLADETGCVVVAVDYRLAPEHPYPAAVDDSLAAYAWVHEHAVELGADPDRIGVMGDSAGATLAAVVAQQVRSLPVAPAVAQALVYPATDIHFRHPSYESCGTGFFLTLPAMEWFRARYLPDPADWDDPRVSPLLADDLGGLPPALVVTAGFDPLRDDGRAYADALAKAGVATTYRCYDDMIHGFFGMGVLPEAYAAAIEICRDMGRLMERSNP